MCDYSLESMTSRPAKVGDKLQVRQFSTGTQGFVEVGGDITCPVCVPPGAELAFDNKIEKYELVGYAMIGKIETDHTVACFGHRNPEVRHTHHDCLEFPDGSHVMLQHLIHSQTATVLQLPAEPKAEPKAAEETKSFVRELEPAQA